MPKNNGIGKEPLCSFIWSKFSAPIPMYNDGDDGPDLKEKVIRQLSEENNELSEENSKLSEENNELLLENNELKSTLVQVWLLIHFFFV